MWPFLAEPRMRDSSLDHVDCDFTIDELRTADVNARLDAARNVRDLDPARASADVLSAPILTRRPVLQLQRARVHVHGRGLSTVSETNVAGAVLALAALTARRRIVRRMEAACFAVAIGALARAELVPATTRSARCRVVAHGALNGVWAVQAIRFHHTGLSMNQSMFTTARPFLTVRRPVSSRR